MSVELGTKHIGIAQLVHTTDDSLVVDLLTLVTDDSLTAEVTGGSCILVSCRCDVLIILLTVS